MINLSKALKSRKKELNHSNRQVCDAIGVEIHTLYKYLNGVNIPNRPYVAESIASYLGVDAKEIPMGSSGRSTKMFGLSAPYHLPTKIGLNIHSVNALLKAEVTSLSEEEFNHILEGQKKYPILTDLYIKAVLTMLRKN